MLGKRMKEWLEKYAMAAAFAEAGESDYARRILDGDRKSTRAQTICRCESDYPCHLHPEQDMVGA